MFFFFSSTNTEERVDRLNVKQANAEIQLQLSIAKYSSESRRMIAQLEIINLMSNNSLNYISGSGVVVELKNDSYQFIY
jgi:hypothetical protein